MRFRVFFLSLGISIFLLVGSSLAQLEEVWFFTGTLVSWEKSDVISVINGWWFGIGSITTGQIMTGLDNEVKLASELEYIRTDTTLLSGENDMILSWWEGTGEINSWTTTGINADPIARLILTEVYYDGTDEWIEITNIGDGNFQGNITLVGVKSTPLSLTNISFISGESKIFGDTLSMISGTSYIGKTGLALNIIDTTAIDIQMSISGQLQDTFAVDQVQVNLYNDKKTSFEKVYGLVLPVRPERVSNALSGYSINPGIYIASENNPGDSIPPPTQSWGNLQLLPSCDFVDQRDLIKINEIFAWNEKYPSYIELIVHDTITLNSLSISGDLLATGIEFLWETWGSTLEKNSLLVVTATGFRQNEGMVSVQNNDFSLLSTWKNLLITIGSWQSRRVMDIISISGDIVGRSIYFANTSHPCGRIFDVLDDFSPGFEKRFLKYFAGSTSTKIEYILTGNGNQWVLPSCPLSWQNQLFSWEIQGTTGILSLPNEYSIHILNVEYDPEGSDTNNEKITLLATSRLNTPLALDLSKIFRLKVNGSNKTLPWSLPMNIPTTFIKTFGFPNSTDGGKDVVIQLTYDDYIFDTYTYNPNIPKLVEEEKQVETGDLMSTGTVRDISGLQFIITYVLPNPIGSDKTEELGLLVNYPTATTSRGSGEIIWSVQTGSPLLRGWRDSVRRGWREGIEGVNSWINLSQGFSLKIGKTIKKLKGSLNIGQENIISGSLGLVNKAACVSLFYQSQELTKFCYRNPKEGEKISASSSWMEQTTQENIDILTELQLKRVGNQLCIWYKDQSFLCKRIPASKAEIKVTQEQKLYKWFASLIKQYIITNWKWLYYDTPIKEYFDLITKNKKIIAQGKSTVDIYGQKISITDIKQQLQVINNTLPTIVALFEGVNWLWVE